MQLSYVIIFVDDMTAGVEFYRDTLGLPLRFASPEWTEFDTVATTLALHPSSKENPAGISRLGFSVADMTACQARLEGAGVSFTRQPAAEHGILLAEFTNPTGVRFSLSAPMKAEPAGR